MYENINGRRVKVLSAREFGGKNIPLSELKKSKVVVSCAMELEDGSTLFGCYRPPRRRDESPIQYYRRAKCVDDRYTHVHKGWYYCNPAHCSNRWRKKAERDEHLERAYGALM